MLQMKIYLESGSAAPSLISRRCGDLSSVFVTLSACMYSSHGIVPLNETPLWATVPLTMQLVCLSWEGLEWRNKSRHQTPGKRS